MCVWHSRRRSVSCAGRAIQQRACACKTSRCLCWRRATRCLRPPASDVDMHACKGFFCTMLCLYVFALCRWMWTPCVRCCTRSAPTGESCVQVTPLSACRCYPHPCCALVHSSSSNFTGQSHSLCSAPCSQRTWCPLWPFTNNNVNTLFKLFGASLFTKMNLASLKATPGPL